jgi:hypothetical protein
LTDGSDASAEAVAAAAYSHAAASSARAHRETRESLRNFHICAIPPKLLRDLRSVEKIDTRAV